MKYNGIDENNFDANSNLQLLPPKLSVLTVQLVRPAGLLRDFWFGVGSSPPIPIEAGLSQSVC